MVVPHMLDISTTISNYILTIREVLQPARVITFLALNGQSGYHCQLIALGGTQTEYIPDLTCASISLMFMSNRDL